MGPRETDRQQQRHDAINYILLFYGKCNYRGGLRVFRREKSLKVGETHNGIASDSPWTIFENNDT